MMENKRPWFQLRLSTCVVLMTVAGLLMWANVTRPEGQWSYGWPTAYATPSLIDLLVDMKAEDSGIVFVKRGSLRVAADMTTPSSDSVSSSNPLPLSAGPNDWSKWSYRHLAINMFVAFSILVTTAVACEWSIRRRAQSKRASGESP